LEEKDPCRAGSRSGDEIENVMRQSTRSILGIAGLFAVAPVYFPAPQTVAVERKSSRAAKGSDGFLNGPPFTLDQVLRLLAQNAIPLRRRKEAIQNRGVDFSMSKETAEKLKAAGAPEDILELIKSKSKPVAETATLPPQPPPVGNIALSCAPAECEIAVNGTPRGSTANGSLPLDELAPGNYVIDFTRDGYISRQNTVLVEEDKTTVVSVALEANRETQETFGADLFQKMIQALGGDEALKELATVQAAGSATMLTREGSGIRWAIRMRSRPDRALFQAKTGSVMHEVMFVGNEFTASKSLKGQDALELPTEFGLIRDHQLATLLARLDKPPHKKLASQAEPAADAEFALFAEGGTDRISIGLDSELRPQRVRITTVTGVGSVLITYSDYVQIQHAWYPKSMRVKPEGDQHGVEVHFDTVELNPKLKDTDFKLKSKFFSTLYN
jgi:PEGA domain-containing protein